MDNSTDVDLIYADLEDAHLELQASITSPKRVRRAFSRFVELSQRLTSVIRKQFKAETGSELKASEFEGWNAATNLFKELRNNEQHEYQTHISVLDTRYYNIFEDDEQLLAVSGTWEIADQLMEAPPDAITISGINAKTGMVEEKEYFPIRTEHRFLIRPRTQAIEKKIQDANTADLHQLSKNCMQIFNKYYHFYLAKTRRPPFEA